MEKFKFHQDVKISVWVRQTFEIEADNKESALMKAEQFKTEDVSDELDLLENNVLWNTQELLSPKDNGDECTIELYDGDTCIGRNTD